MFDFQFKTFITLKLVSLLYILGLAAIVANGVAQIAAVHQFEALKDYNTLFLIGGSLVSALSLRVMLELIVVIFRIEKNTRG
ncbi:MAG TPA: DUF4282 domain-containing protein [Planctomycetes bacterium]|nr:DUF4282 domain-containing protein [Planctomycetota bacterium]HIL38760.1 DUF4282 domain-containing protein [Planctomycetota bacterium]